MFRVLPGICNIVPLQKKKPRPGRGAVLYGSESIREVIALSRQRSLRRRTNQGICPKRRGTPRAVQRKLQKTRGRAKARPYSLKSSRMRLICERLTGISVCFLSFILSMKVDLNHGTTSLM